MSTYALFSDRTHPNDPKVGDSNEAASQSNVTPAAGLPAAIIQEPVVIAAPAPVQPGGLEAVFGEAQEAINGRAAQLGFLAAVVTELVTGQVGLPACS